MGELLLRALSLLGAAIAAVFTLLNLPGFMEK